ncbi:hypothetical protein PUN4_80034 [Paraburkholderia unamae]|nr:hypothetical protein PUN4_80034 [Paraburkholderia unamae]
MYDAHGVRRLGQRLNGWGAAGPLREPHVAAGARLVRMDAQDASTQVG